MFDREAVKEIAQSEAISAADSALTAKVDSVTALPADFTVHDLEKYLMGRRRVRGTMTTSALAAFAAYATKHAENGATVFVNQKQLGAAAVLNLGTPADPGHADNQAKFTPQATAAYIALCDMASGHGKSQKEVAEFLEDWAGSVVCSRGGDVIETKHAIAAVRKITIEALRRGETTEQQLSATRSAFESVAATSSEPLPTLIRFRTVPYQGLTERSFDLRLGILTSDKPQITLRVINAEQHAEEMAAELTALVENAIAGAMPVLIGTYSAGA